MKRSFLLLALGLLLVLIAATTVAVYAAGLSMVYVDSTGIYGNGTGAFGTLTNPVPIAQGFQVAINLLDSGKGQLIIVYNDGQGGFRQCTYQVANSQLSTEPPVCSPATPPATGEPIATATWWIGGAVLAAALLVSGIFLRSRSSLRV